MLGIILSDLFLNIQIVLTLFIFVWIFSWAKQALGSAKLAIIFALIVVFLTFVQFPELIWLAVILVVLATFGSEVFSKINPFSGEDHLH